MGSGKKNWAITDPNASNKVPTMIAEANDPRVEKVKRVPESVPPISG